MNQCRFEKVIENEYIAIILGAELITSKIEVESCPDILCVYSFHAFHEEHAHEHMDYLIRRNFTNDEISKITGYRLIQVKNETNWHWPFLPNLTSLKK